MKNKVDTQKPFKPKRASYKPTSSLQKDNNPPQLPKEYYDSMLEAYKNEEEKVVTCD